MSEQDKNEATVNQQDVLQEQDLTDPQQAVEDTRFDDTKSESPTQLDGGDTDTGSPRLNQGDQEEAEFQDYGGPEDLLQTQNLEGLEQSMRQEDEAVEEEEAYHTQLIKEIENEQEVEDKESVTSEQFEANFEKQMEALQQEETYDNTQSQMGQSKQISVPLNLSSYEEITSQIEGFEDDFNKIVTQQTQETEAPTRIDEFEEEEIPQEIQLEQKILQAQQDQALLQEQNLVLQKQVRQVLNTKVKERLVTQLDPTQQEHAELRYKLTLKQWYETMDQLENTRNHYNIFTDQLQQEVNKREAALNTILKQFRQFKLDISKFAEYERTGKVLPQSRIRAIEKMEKVKEEELRQLRLDNIVQKKRLNILEQNLEKKEQLGQGLHLIDFEQLKIENQSYVEKIEERNEEIVILRKKTITTVQVISHFREKCHCFRGEVEDLKEQLKQLEEQYFDKREILSNIKSQREKLRLKVRKMQENSMYINNQVLIDNFQAKKEQKEHLIFQVNQMEQKLNSANTIMNNSTTKKMVLVVDQVAS